MFLTLLKQSLMLAAMLPSATAFGVGMEPPKPVFFRGVLDKKGALSSAGQGATPKALPRNIPEVRTAVPMSPKVKIDLGIPLSKQEETIYIAQLNNGLFSKTFNNQLLLGVILVPSVITLILASTALEANYLTQRESFDARVEVARLDARVEAESRLYQLKNEVSRHTFGHALEPREHAQRVAGALIETVSRTPCTA